MLSNTRSFSTLKDWGLKPSKRIGFNKAKVVLVRKLAMRCLPGGGGAGGAPPAGLPPRDRLFQPRRGLGTKMGVYDMPYENFGRLSYEIWRASRLVIDTGIHHYGWTRDRVQQYLRDHTALSEHEIETEAKLGMASISATSTMRSWRSARCR